MKAFLIMWGKKMNCKICNKEVFAKNTGKEPVAFMSVNPKSADDVRCAEHKNK